MFCIKLAGIPIGIDNRYAYVRRLCAGYETAGRPAFTVRASEREIRAEQGGVLLVEIDIVVDGRDVGSTQCIGTGRSGGVQVVIGCAVLGRHPLNDRYQQEYV